jgi:ABC-type transport system substrate-binding protein
MPQISDGGRTYTIKVKPGIYFAADPAFKGRKRELVAEDYVYSIKRVFDPKVRSYWLYLFENNLVGLDDVLAQARKTGSLDYDAPIEGVRTLDKVHFAHQVQESRLCVPVVAHVRRTRGGGTRGRRRLQG